MLQVKPPAHWALIDAKVLEVIATRSATNTNRIAQTLGISAKLVRESTERLEKAGKIVISRRIVRKGGFTYELASP